MTTKELEERFYKIGVIPVIALDDAKDASALGDALMKGGLPAAEVTFRTAAAVDTIKTLKKELSLLPAWKSSLTKSKVRFRF